MTDGKYIDINVIEVAGFSSALKALRLPFGKEVRSFIDPEFFIDGEKNNIVITQTASKVHEKDLDLMSRLVRNGDEHAKVIRGIMVWMEIDAPRYWWAEMDTYRVGTDRLASESTMHIQGKGLTTEELIAMKEGLTEGTRQKRVQVFSYQTLRRIYLQRRHHRLPHWLEFCKVIEELPFANELILTGIKNKNE